MDLTCNVSPQRAPWVLDEIEFQRINTASRGCEDFFAIGYTTFFLWNGIFHDADALLGQAFNSVFSNQLSNRSPSIAPSYCKGAINLPVHRTAIPIGHLEKLAFCVFFEIAASCNSLDYRELQHRIFKVASKKLRFLEVPKLHFFRAPLVMFILQCALYLFILKLITAEAVETVREAYQPFA